MNLPAPDEWRKFAWEAELQGRLLRDACCVLRQFRDINCDSDSLRGSYSCWVLRPTTCVNFVTLPWPGKRSPARYFPLPPTSDSAKKKRDSRSAFSSESDA